MYGLYDGSLVNNVERKLVNLDDKILKD